MNEKVEVLALFSDLLSFSDFVGVLRASLTKDSPLCNALLSAEGFPKEGDFKGSSPFFSSSLFFSFSSLIAYNWGIYRVCTFLIYSLIIGLSGDSLKRSPIFIELFEFLSELALIKDYWDCMIISV